MISYPLILQPILPIRIVFVEPIHSILSVGLEGALKGGLSRPLVLLTKTWLIVCTPPFTPIISEIDLVGSVSLCGQTLHWAPSHSPLLIGRARRRVILLVAETYPSETCVVLAVSKFWKVVC